MSILLASTGSTTAPTAAEELLASAIILVPAMVVALVLAKVTGVLRRDGILGPTRIDTSEPVIPLLVITFIGGLVWLGSQVCFGIVKGIQWAQSHPDEKFELDKLAAGEMAFLAIVPAGVAFALLVLGDFFAPNQLSRRIGYALRNLPRGVLYGVIAIFIVLPIMWTFSAVVEWVYRRAGIEHPNTHELLKAMKEASPWARMALVIGACVAAPMFEELLFRGHIQTVLLRMFMARPRKFAPIMPLANVLPEGFASNSLPPPQLEPAPVPVAEKFEPESRWRRLLMTWLAVVITSVMFTAVHPLWMAPLIFLLSISLGFAYERTGNLWTPIMIHSLFNTSSTLIYLNLT